MAHVPLRRLFDRTGTGPAFNLRESQLFINFAIVNFGAVLFINFAIENFGARVIELSLEAPLGVD